MFHLDVTKYSVEDLQEAIEEAIYETLCDVGITVNSKNNEDYEILLDDGSDSVEVIFTLTTNKKIGQLADLITALELAYQNAGYKVWRGFAATVPGQYEWENGEIDLQHAIFARLELDPEDCRNRFRLVLFIECFSLV